MPISQRRYGRAIGCEDTQAIAQLNCYKIEYFPPRFVFHSAPVSSVAVLLETTSQMIKLRNHVIQFKLLKKQSKTTRIQLTKKQVVIK